ncbi:hypothetical protein HUJ05_008851 [Dendroctonus ponderosae]|nr:hypothetical protein HUJ05_008851 [Dendroctonus ponderosae]
MINIKKTKVMTIKISKNVSVPIQLNGEVLEQVERFRYLRCSMDCKLDPDAEIRCRIKQARNCVMRLKKLLCDSRLSLSLQDMTVSLQAKAAKLSPIHELTESESGKRWLQFRGHLLAEHKLKMMKPTNNCVKKHAPIQSTRVD